MSKHSIEGEGVGPEEVDGATVGVPVGTESAFLVGVSVGLDVGSESVEIGATVGVVVIGNLVGAKVPPVTMVGATRVLGSDAVVLDKIVGVAV